MTPQVLLTNDGTIAYEDGGAGGTATGAGALRFRDGKFAGTQAALVEEGTTNVLPNPSFETNTANWWIRSGGTLSRVNTHPTHGDWNGQHVAVGPAQGVTTPTTTIAAELGQTWTFSVDVVGAGEYRVAVEEWGGGWQQGSYADPSSPDEMPRRLSISRTFTDPDTTHVAAWVRTNLAQTWNFDAAQLEQKDHATTFCPELDGSGNLLPGYDWTGTAHNSASTRAAASITIPYAGTLGSLACWYSEDMGETWNWHYAEALGSIGTYGDISDDGGGNLVVTSDRALLLGPLAVWSDTLTSGEQDGMQALGAMWTWADVEQVTVVLDTAMTATGTSAATADTALTLGTAASAAGTSTAMMDTTLLAYLDIAAGTAGTSTATMAVEMTRILDTGAVAAGASTATANTTAALTTGAVAAGTSTATASTTLTMLGIPLGSVGYLERPGLTVTSTLRPAPIAAGYMPRPPSED